MTPASSSVCSPGRCGLDKLRSSEVKDYLLQIFRRDLPDASIDFKAEWDKALPTSTLSAVSTWPPNA